MASKSFNMGMLAMALVFVLALTGCDGGNDGGSGSNGGSGGNSGGTLTVINAPQVARACVCADAPTPTTVSELSVMPLVAMAATSRDVYSPYSLLDANGTPFTRTGNFSVLLRAAGNNTYNSLYYFKGGVSFINGSATIDLYSMTMISPLDGYL